MDTWDNLPFSFILKKYSVKMRFLYLDADESVKSLFIE